MTCCAVSTVSGVPGGGGGGSSDPPISPTNVRFLDDFEGDITSAGGGFNNFQPILGWNRTNVSEIDGELGHPGIWQLEIDLAATFRAMIFSGDTFAGGTNPVNVQPGTGNGVWRVEWCARINQLATGGEPFGFFAGLNQRPRPDQTTWRRIGFRYNQGDTEFQIETHNGAAGTSADSGITVVAGQWYRLRVETDINWSSIDYFIDDVNVGTITTTIPTDPLAYMIGFGDDSASGSTTKTVDVDYFFLHANPPRPA